MLICWLVKCYIRPDKPRIYKSSVIVASAAMQGKDAGGLVCRVAGLGTAGAALSLSAVVAHCVLRAPAFASVLLSGQGNTTQQERTNSSGVDHQQPEPDLGLV